MAEKTITGWLVVDWKKAKHRTRQSKPDASEIGTNEVLAKLTIDVTIPDIEIPELAVQINVPEPNVRAATLEALSDDELPDWTDIANDEIPDTIPVEPEAFYNEVNRVTLDTLESISVPADASDVREYVRRTMKDIVNNGGDGS